MDHRGIGHRSTARLAPDPLSEDLVAEMLSMDDVMATILDETIPTDDSSIVHESGRTMCGGSGDIRGPLARYPSAVSLAECPVESTGGTWHTHVTKDELREPHNSLPDTANVVFGHIDASMVVGTRSVDVVMAPSDPQAGIQAFNDAIGLDLSSTEEVVDAIMDGHVPNPVDARHRVRRRLSPLIQRHRISFADLDARLAGSGIPASAPGGQSIEMLDAQRFHDIQMGVTQRHHNRKNPVRTPAGTREWSRTTASNVKAGATQMNVGTLAAQTAVGEVVGRAVRALLP